MTHWKVSLLFSLEDTRHPWFPTRMSNLDSSDHSTLFTLKLSILNESWPTDMTALLDHVHIWLPFCMTELSWHLQMARQIVFTDSGFWKYSWAHLVIPMTESCRRVMQCRLRAWRPWTSHKRSLALSLTHRDFSSFSESFDDVIHCRLWDCKAFAIWWWGTVKLVFNYSTIVLCTLSTDWRASAHLYFRETLPLQDIPFIANHVTGLMSINLISC